MIKHTEFNLKASSDVQFLFVLENKSHIIYDFGFCKVNEFELNTSWMGDGKFKLNIPVKSVRTMSYV